MSSRLQLDDRNLSLGRRHLVNAYDVKAGIGIIAGRTVWSMPEHLAFTTVSHSQMVLRPTYPYQIPLAKTSRRGRDFVPYCISKSSSYAAYSPCLGLLYILEYLIVRLVRFVLLLLLFNFVMHCIISTVVVAFEINYLILSYKAKNRNSQFTVL